LGPPAGLRPRGAVGPLVTPVTLVAHGAIVTEGTISRALVLHWPAFAERTVVAGGTGIAVPTIGTVVAGGTGIAVPTIGTATAGRTGITVPTIGPVAAVAIVAAAVIAVPVVAVPIVARGTVTVSLISRGVRPP
jgi:hypothetical protein